MSVDRQITWLEPPHETSGRPTIDKLKEVAQDFLGPRWEVYIKEGATQRCWLHCHCPDKMTYPLISQQTDWDFAQQQVKYYSGRTRGFYVFFSGEHGEKQTAVSTAQADEFSSALADQFCKLISRFWNGSIRWPT
jgi:hypothetical protein